MFVKYRVENFLKLINIRGLFIKVWVIFGYRYMCSYQNVDQKIVNKDLVR